MKWGGEGVSGKENQLTITATIYPLKNDVA